MALIRRKQDKRPIDYDRPGLIRCQELLWMETLMGSSSTVVLEMIDNLRREKDPRRGEGNE